MGLCFAHGSTPCSIGEGGFFGALAIDDDCDGTALGAGSALIGRLPDDAEDGAADFIAG